MSLDCPPRNEGRRDTLQDVAIANLFSIPSGQPSGFTRLSHSSRSSDNLESTGGNDSVNEVSLQEMYRSVPVAADGSWFSKLKSYMGPGILIAVGYMDPGNWATDMAGGSAYNNKLLFVILISNLMAMFLQGLSMRLGMVSRKDLAQVCRAHFYPWVNILLWITCEVAIAACDLAEVIGSAIAMKLLFGLPVIYGCLITAADVLLLLFFGRFSRSAGAESLPSPARTTPRTEKKSHVPAIPFISLSPRRQRAAVRQAPIILLHVFS